MSESGDYDPGPWRGHDFAKARKDYDAHAGRSYDEAKTSGKSNKDLLPESIATESSWPLLIWLDITGSMKKWPSIIVSKLPYLEFEAKEYLGKDLEICWGALGDAYCDDYPIQARPFTKGVDLKTRIDELVIVGGGGGQTRESYELAALYLARKVQIPRAINKPILIIIGDEQPYDFVDKAQAQEYADVEIKGRLSTKEVFEELKSKYAVYFIRKPYDENSGDRMSYTDSEIYKHWVKLLGEDHIAILPKADRVVDVIFGILAKETNRVEYFKKEIEGRQVDKQGRVEKEKVDVVYKSLETVHTTVVRGDSKLDSSDGKSVTRVKGEEKAKKAKSLL